MNMLFNKVRDVKSPTQAYNYPAGTDFYIPSYSPEFYTDLTNKNPHKEYYECSVSPNRDSMSIVIAPHGRILIPSGIRVILNDPNTCLLAVNKSGIEGAAVTYMAYPGDAGPGPYTLVQDTFVVDKEFGFVNGLAQEIGDYYVPYNSFLAAISLFNIEPCYPIVILSSIFDYLIVFAVYKFSALFLNSGSVYSPLFSVVKKSDIKCLQTIYYRLRCLCIVFLCKVSR